VFDSCGSKQDESIALFADHNGSETMLLKVNLSKEEFIQGQVEAKAREEAKKEEKRKLALEREAKQKELQSLRNNPHKFWDYFSDFNYEQIGGYKVYEDGIGFYTVSNKGSGFHFYKDYHSIINRTKLKYDEVVDILIESLDRMPYVEPSVRQNYQMSKEYDYINVAHLMFKDSKQPRFYVTMESVNLYVAQSLGVLEFLFGGR
jgi:hypothetical protein